MPTKQDKMLEVSIAEFKVSNKLDTIAPLLDARVEFSYIPLSSIVVEKQVRSEEITDGEEFQSLVESIREKGVLEPVLVVGITNNKYKLVTGERRYQASEAAGRFNIPARILEDTISETDIMLIQLIENLQRKDLNSVDEAKGYLEYYKLMCKDKSMDADAIIKAITKYELKPDTADKLSVVNLTTIQKISGKSLTYVKRLVSILKLPEEALEALKNRSINMAQSLVFVNHTGHPKFFDVLEKAIKSKLTAKSIERAFVEKKRGGEVAFFKKRIIQVRNEIEKNKSKISRQYVAELKKEVSELSKLLNTM